MAHKALILALSTILAASPLGAQPDPGPTAAPPGSAGTLYCLRVAVAGHVAEQVLCLSRDEWWMDQDVDVDKEWGTNGVRTIG